MSDMQTTIGTFNAETRQVPVTFTQGAVTFERTVNACFGESGLYDPDATAVRIADVALGVENKIALGIIASPPAAAPDAESH